MRGCTLYRFYDVEGRLLYVGVTSVGPSRWSDHELHKVWWVRVVRTTVEHYPDRATALAAEQAAILAEQPIHNVVHVKPHHPVTRQHKRSHGSGGMTLKSDGRWHVSIWIDGVRRQHSIRGELAARLLLLAYEARTLPRVDRERATRVLEELQ